MEFAALKKAVEEVVILIYHLWYMGVKVSNPSPIFGNKISVVLNENSPGVSLNNKTVVLSYNFVIEHVANCVIEVRKIGRKYKYADPFTKAFISNKFRVIYHKYMVYG